MAHVVPKKQGRNTYYALQESYRGTDGKVHTRHLRYLGKADDLGNVHNSEIGDIRPWGGVRAALSLAEVLNIGKIADAAIPKGGGVRPGDLLTILVLNRLLEPCSKLRVEQWYSSTALEEMLEVDGKKLSAQNLCAFLDYLTDEKVAEMEAAWAELLEKKFQISMESIIFDITSTYTYGSIDGLSAHGYSRDGRPDLEQVNIGLAVTRPHYFPIMHRVFPGNMSDVTTLPSTAAALRAQRSEGITLVFDRGFLSEKNIAMLDELGFHFLCGAEWTAEVECIALQAKYGLSVEGGLRPLRVRSKDDQLSLWTGVREVYGRPRRVVVLHSSAMETADKENRERRLAEAEEELRTLQESCQTRCKSHDLLAVGIHKILEGVKRYFTTNIEDIGAFNDIVITPKASAQVDGRRLRWQNERLPAFIATLQALDLSNQELRARIRDELGDLRPHYDVEITERQARSTFTFARKVEEVDVTSLLDGYFVLLATDTALSGEEILDTYTEKDGVEKAFHIHKGPIEMAPMHHWTAQRVKGHIFVCVVAYLVYAFARFLLKRAGRNESVEDALHALQRIVSYQAGGKRCLSQISAADRELLLLFYSQL